MEIEIEFLPTLKRNDWIIKVYRMMHLNPIGFFFAYSIINFILDYFLANQYGVWNKYELNGMPRPGLSGEPGSWAIDYIAQPLFFGLYVWFNDEAAKILKELFKNKKIKKEERSFKIIANYHKVINSKWFSRLAIIIGTTILFFVEVGIIKSEGNPTWSNSHIEILLCRSVMAIPMYIIVFLLIFQFSYFFMTYNKIINIYGLHVEPMHSDNAGGLGNIGRFTSNLGYVILGFGLALVLIFWQSIINADYVKETSWLFGAVIYLIVYLMIAPLAFILPLLSTHREMVKDRDEILTMISTEVEIISTQLNSLKITKKFTGQNLIDAIEKIQHMEELSGFVKKYPTWPIANRSIKKYFSLVSSPALLVFPLILQLYIGDFLQKNNLYNLSKWISH